MYFRSAIIEARLNDISLYTGMELVHELGLVYRNNYKCRSIGNWCMHCAEFIFLKVFTRYRDAMG